MRVIIIIIIIIILAVNVLSMDEDRVMKASLRNVVEKPQASAVNLMKLVKY